MQKNINHVKTIKKGGNLDYILFEISNFYDNYKQKKFNQLKFIGEYCGLLLEKFNLESLDLYIDNDLLKNNKCLGYHYQGKIFINNLFFKNKENFFKDLLTLTHEFSHFINYNNRINICRKVGKNSQKIKINFNEEILKELNLNDRFSANILYCTNEAEHSANVFAYEYVLDLIEKCKQIIEKNNLNYTFLKTKQELIKHSFNAKELLYEKYLTQIIPSIIEKVRTKQNEWYKSLKETLKNNFINKLEVDKNFFNLIRTKDKIIETFGIYENFEVLQKMKNLFLKFSKKSIYCEYLYIEILNYVNYVVTKKDILELANIFKNSKISYELKNFNLNQRDFKENLIKAKFKFYDKKFEKFIDLNKILFSKNLFDDYYFYKKIKDKKLINSN